MSFDPHVQLLSAYMLIASISIFSFVHFHSQFLLSVTCDMCGYIGAGEPSAAL